MYKFIFVNLYLNNAETAATENWNVKVHPQNAWSLRAQRRLADGYREITTSVPEMRRALCVSW
jgi:hypothetical protein